MPNRSEAEEHLRVIRSLMEKATIYRAISAPTALVGGLCSLLFGEAFPWLWKHWPTANVSPIYARWFVTCWVMVLALTSLANGIFILRAARLRKEPFVSPAMRKALWALFPSMLCGGVFTVLLMFTESEVARWCLPGFWMVFYGLALLATAQFSPRSIPLLGWCFLSAGLLLLGFYSLPVFNPWWIDGHHMRHMVAHKSMIATFGLFHLIYAVCTWPRKTTSSDSVGEG